MTREQILKYSEFLSKVAKVDKTKRATRLWAVCAEVKIRPGEWKGIIYNVHAYSKANAIAQFLLAETRPVHIADAAPILGYWVDDKDGNELSV